MERGTGTAVADSVERISEKWMSNRCHVKADLRRAAGFQTAAHDGPERILKDSLVVCNSPQAVPFFTDTHFSDTFPRRIERIRVISWNLLHGKTNGFFLRFFGKGMVYQSQVFFFQRAALPLPGQSGSSQLILCK